MSRTNGLMARVGATVLAIGLAAAPTAGSTPDPPAALATGAPAAVLTPDPVAARAAAATALPAGQAGYPTPAATGFHHLGLLYHNEKRGPADWATWVAQHEKGAPIPGRWLFDAFLTVDLTAPSGTPTDGAPTTSAPTADAPTPDAPTPGSRTAGVGTGDAVAAGAASGVTAGAVAAGGVAGAGTAADWTALLDRWLGTAAAVDAAITTVAAARTRDGTVMGAPPTRRKLVVTVPWADPAQAAFGMVDGRTADLRVPAERDRVTAWYLDQVGRRFAAAGYRNLDLWGVYLMREDLLPADEPWTARTTAAAHRRGLKVAWIPYFQAPGWDRWRAAGIDAAIMQPGYGFRSPADGGTVDAGRLRTTAQLAVRAGLGVAVEARGSAGDDYQTALFRQYLTEGIRLGHRDGASAYFLGHAARPVTTPPAYTALADYLTGRPVRSTDPQPTWHWSTPTPPTAAPATSATPPTAAAPATFTKPPPTTPLLTAVTPSRPATAPRPPPTVAPSRPTVPTTPPTSTPPTPAPSTSAPPLPAPPDPGPPVPAPPDPVPPVPAPPTSVPPPLPQPPAPPVPGQPGPAPGGSVVATAGFAARGDLTAVRVEFGGTGTWRGRVSAELLADGGWRAGGTAYAGASQPAGTGQSVLVPLEAVDRVRGVRVTFRPDHGAGRPHVDRLVLDTVWPTGTAGPATGAPYTVSTGQPPPGRYPDPTGLLTDGHWSTTGWWNAHPVGWWDQQVRILFDLGTVRPVDRVVLHTHHSPDAAVNWPTAPAVHLAEKCPVLATAVRGAVEDCGVTTLSGAAPELTAAHGTSLDGTVTFTAPPGRPAPARFATLTVRPTGWFLADEVRIVAGGKDITAQVSYRLLSPPTTQGRDDGVRLTDGNAAPLMSAPAVTGWRPPTGFSTTVDLLRPATVCTVTAWFVVDHGWGVVRPVGISVDTSVDGRTWQPLGRTTAPARTWFAAIAFEAAGPARSARFVRLTVPPAAAAAPTAWHMLSEVGAGRFRCRE